MNKKRILTSALIGTIALVGLSVSLTLAWYGASDRLNMRSLDVTVAGQTTLKISETGDADSFVSDLNISPKDDEVFVPVTSMMKDKWMNKVVQDEDGNETIVKGDTPVFLDCSSSLVPASGIPSPDEMTYGFFQKKLYLMTTLDYYVTLDPEQSVFSIFDGDAERKGTDDRAEQVAKELNDKYGEPGHPYTTVEEVKEKLHNLLNCLRISILIPEEKHYNYYIVDPFKEKVVDENGQETGEYKETVYGGILDNNRDGYYDVYKNLQGEAREVVYGEVVDRSKIVYDNPVCTDPSQSQSKPKTDRELGPHFEDSSFVAEHRDTAYTYNERASLDNGLEFVKEDSLALGDLGDRTNNSLLIPCFGNQPREIVVSIYFEGWDLDCINATMGACFSTKLSFKLLRGIIG